MVDSLRELFTNNNKVIMLHLRKPELRDALIQQTAFLPDTVTISERAYCYKHNIKEIQKCPYCGKPRRFQKMDKGYFATCGDSVCKGKGIAKGVEKHDFTEIQKKMRATYKAKTGYEHNMQNPEFLKQFFDKREQDTGERYAINSERSKIAREKTLLEKFGTTVVRDFINNEEVKQNIITKYGSIEAMRKQQAIASGKSRKENDLKKLIAKLDKLGYEYIDTFFKDSITEYMHIKCKRCGYIFDISRTAANIYHRTNKSKICPKCDYIEMTFRSNFEREIADFIQNLVLDNYTVLLNKHINKFEYDIVIPEKKIAIECNGLYWHSEYYKDKIWHLIKKKALEAEGYTVIQIWEDDWHYKQDIVKSRLKTKLGYTNNKIYARKCSIIQLKSKDVESFLNENHIQGAIKAAYNYGLFYNEELIQLVCIGKSRKAISKNKHNAQYELLRMVTKQNYNIVGGFSKLIKAFKKDNPDKSLFSYVDLSWSNINGSGYINAGWKLDGQTGIDYWWVKKDKHPIRQNRIQFQKHKIIESEEDKSKTEDTLMHEKGYYKVYGLGNLIMTYK